MPHLKSTWTKLRMLLQRMCHLNTVFFAPILEYRVYLDGYPVYLDGYRAFQDEYRVFPDVYQVCLDVYQGSLGEDLPGLDSQMVPLSG
jgi:hypothetical protein